MFDPALFASMTWLDWTIVGIPALFLLIGLLSGGTSLMLFGLIRFFTALPIAAMPVAYISLKQKPLIQQFAVQTGVPPMESMLIITGVVFIVALIIAYRVLGLLWRGLRSVLSSSFIGRALDRLVGVPLGLIVGAFLSVLLVVSPAVQIRSTMPQSDQPPGLRNSILMPMVEERIRDLIRYIPMPN